MRWIFPLLLLAAFSALATADKPLSGPRAEHVDDDADYFSEALKRLLLEKKPASFVLGKSRQGREVEAYYFPGYSDKNALVIGGVHGSELSSIEVARQLIRQLSAGDSICYNVIVIPSLFPDNAAAARRRKAEIGSVKNIGRYSFAGAPDPNRQMPTPGCAFDEAACRDHAGRGVEEENAWLLQLIHEFKPQRIASIHAIRETQYAGFFADPRTDERGIALGYESDSSLAVRMAAFARQQGADVPGNRLLQRPNALYHKDPKAVAKGSFQPRNFTGSPSPGQRGGGISLGTWGATRVKDEKDPSKNREAMRILTIEFPGSRRPADYENPTRRMQCQATVNAYAAAIRQVFLCEYFVEEAGSPL